MCFNPGQERRVPSPNRYIVDAKFCFCKNNKRIIIIRKKREDIKTGKRDEFVREGGETCDQAGSQLKHIVLTVLSSNYYPTWLECQN
jgi:hypothetical protein